MEAGMSISYGKEEVSVYRTDGVRSLFAAEVGIEVFGDNFWPSYTEGDNSLVIPTDTMKNFIHAVALDYDGESIEEFLALLARRFLATYEHVHLIGVHTRGLPFARASDVLFGRQHDDFPVAQLRVDRSGILDHRAGLHELQLIKITGSSFASFAEDEYTTLPEAVDRLLFVYLDVDWRYAEFDRRVDHSQVRDSLLATFDGFVSKSIQHLVHEMGRRLLEGFPELAEVSFAAQNRLWDTASTSEADPRIKVYTDPRPPYGHIKLTLTR